MNLNQIRKQRLALIAPIEREARARGKRAFRDYPVVTPRLEGLVDLLITDGSRRTAYGALDTLDLVGWNIMKARALKTDLQMVFPSGRLAQAAEKLVDELRASGKAGGVSVLCLTVRDAVQLLKDSAGESLSVTVSNTVETQPEARSHKNGARERLPGSGNGAKKKARFV
jgi:hypothetical protein